MNRKSIAGISIAGIIVLIVGIGWLVREHGQSLDAQCIFNLMCIDGAKQQWALEYFPRRDESFSNAVPTPEDIHRYNSRNQYPMPICPRGGAYTIGRVAEKPTCSFPGHVLTQESEKWPAKFDIHLPYSELQVPEHRLSKLPRNAP